MGDVYAAMMQMEQQTTALPSTPQLSSVRFSKDLDLSRLEQFDAVRFQLLSRACEQRLQTHLMTSTATGEGRTTCAIYLGLAFAQMPQTRVLLIETDLTSPSFDRWFDLPSEPAGLTAFLEGRVQNLDDIMYEVQLPGIETESNNLCIWVIPAGVMGKTPPSTLLTDPKLPILLNRCKDLFDHVVLDSPPLNVNHDACVLGRLCDESVLAVALHRTPGPDVDRAKACLIKHGCEIAGVVLV